MNPRTLLIVDDNEAFLESTRFWLTGFGYQVLTWSDPASAINAITARKPDASTCLMLDVRMPAFSGLDLHDALTERGVKVPIIYMSGHADVPIAVSAMQKGAVTLLEKPFDDAALEQALEAAFAAAARRGSQADGAAALSATPAPAATSAGQVTFTAREAKLSPREREVLGLVIHGIYNKNIADRLGLSIKTVELYRARGMAKMQAHSVAELTRMMVSREVA
jgi:two-component system response regulator FixJ